MMQAMFGVMGFSGGELVLILMVLAVLALGLVAVLVVLYFVFRAARKRDALPPTIPPPLKSSP